MAPLTLVISGVLKPAEMWAGLSHPAVVAVGGMFVISANAWMNSPAGFDWVGGQAINIDPWAAMFNDRMLNMGIHMLIASVAATGFAVAGLHALLLIRNPGHLFHQKAIKIALLFGSVAALVQPVSGDLLAKETAVKQPLKLAAMEAHFETEKGAGLLVGGIPDPDTGEVRYGFKIPWLLSVLAYGDPDATVKGLNDFPKEEHPNVLLTHLSFQIMVGLGSLMMLVGAGWHWLRWRKPQHMFSPRVLWILAVMTPSGFLAVEAGWCVTELGRQPWIIYGVMKTKDALTPMPGLWLPFTLFTGVYVILSVVLVFLMIRQIRSIPAHYSQGAGENPDA